VLLHGIGSTATAFGPLLSLLRRHARRIVAPDYPGHGFSDEPRSPLTPAALFEAVTSALDTLESEPMVLVGNSLGGAVAMHYALARPERVRALVLVSPAGAHATEEEWAELRGAFDFATRAQANAFLDRVYHRTPLFLRLMAHEMPAAMRRRAVRELLASASNADAPPSAALAALRMPVLLVWGKSERLLPTTHFDYFKTHLPSHTLVVEPDGFGHCPHFDDPVRLAERIAEFVRSAPR
jgi:pimeloyl-ACP methyl ester carboxylesterase